MFVPDVNQFEGATWIYANRSIESLITSIPAPALPPPSPLRVLWDRFRQRPLHELPERLARKIRRSVARLAARRASEEQKSLAGASGCQGAGRAKTL